MKTEFIKNMAHLIRNKQLSLISDLGAQSGRVSRVEFARLLADVSGFGVPQSSSALCRKSLFYKWACLLFALITVLNKINMYKTIHIHTDT